jgi:TatD DNase family protein
MIDIGVNLLHPQFDGDRDEVIRRARAAGISRMLITATDLETTTRAIALCQQTYGLFCTAGVHPHDAKDAPEDLKDQLRQLSASSVVRAIGETGLDFNRNFSPPGTQLEIFNAQLEVAAELSMPVFIHDRDSDGGVYECLKRHAQSLPHMVVHCFTGTSEDLRRYLDLGCAIGITGWICDRRRGQTLRELVPEIPLDRLLIETDAPFLLPGNAPSDWHATQAPGASRRRNEPALLSFVAEGIASASGTPARDIIAATTRNAEKVFNLGPEPAPQQ